VPYKSIRINSLCADRSTLERHALCDPREVYRLKLVIVESPAKAKTIEKFLGKDYEVVASYGHVRDLPGSAAEVPKTIKEKPWSRMAVDIENDFTPYYVVPADSKKRISELKKRLKDADELVLATDEDREGESISWHLLELLAPKVPVKRIVFHEITKSAIDEAIANPGEVNDKLVRAQESRRILDRLFGYSLSPVLWKRVRRNLSAGRVQSVAVRLVVEREEERRAFHRAEYWSVTATLTAPDAQGDALEFPANLVTLAGNRIATGKDFDANTGQLKPGKITALDETVSGRVKQALADGVPWKVTRVEQKRAKQRPMPPFITSTLQQAASSLLNMSPSQTMRVAQRLYEGVDMGAGEREGLITYMRTDSVTLSNKALGEAGNYIEEKHGKEYYDGPRYYSTKAKSAQEAHEAIRPTVIHRRPEAVKQYLNADELALYRLIWNRTVASQMTDAVLLKTAVDFAVDTPDGAAILRANGSVVEFKGHLAVADSGQSDTVLPPIQEGQGVGPGETIALGAIEANRHETKPPGRYTEASLVKRLEEEGIGRPSTYAPTISTIQNRGYVEKRGNTLVPTFLGVAVTQVLRKHFDEYIDLQFTARMEDALDNIAEGSEDWVDFLKAFYRGQGKFGPGLEEQIEKQLPGIEYPAIPIGDDPETGEAIVVRLGRNAPYLQRASGGDGNTSPVPEDVLYDELTPERAHDLLAERAQGDEPLGNDPETGMPVFALLGPYGPYVQLGETPKPEEGSKKKPAKPKRTSLPKGANLSDVSLDMALEYLSLPRTLGEHPETGKKITTAIGRFGPYVKHDNDFRSLKAADGDTPFNVTLERALQIFAQPKRGRGASKKVLNTRKPRSRYSCSRAATARTSATAMSTRPYRKTPTPTASPSTEL